jgi:hypothetical protein
VNPGIALLPVIARRGGASVVPENAGPQWLFARIKQRGAMHLAGQPDAFDYRQLLSVRCLQGVQRGKGRLEPLRGILLEIARLRRGNRQGPALARNHTLRAVDENSLDRRGAEIDAEIHGCLQLLTSVW